MAAVFSPRLRLATLAAILAAGALAWTVPIPSADGAADRPSAAPPPVAVGPSAPVSIAVAPFAPALMAAASTAEAPPRPPTTVRGGERRWRQAERERRITKPRASRAERRRDRARGPRFAFRPYINLNHADRTR